MSLSRASGQGTSTLRNATVAALRQRLKPKLAGNNRFSGWVGWLPKLVACVCNQVVNSKDLLRGKWSCDIYFVYFVTKSEFQTNNTNT